MRSSTKGGIAPCAVAGRIGWREALVLPGVGAFGDCVQNLKKQGLWETLREWLGAGKPFLGICLGYQILFESSEETPGEEGLGFFPGVVRRFGAKGLKSPHMGWNTLELNSPRHPLWEGLPDDPYVFFVHSYFPVPDDSRIVTSRATYGETFAASVASGNIAAMQFHPKKSQATGLAILRNFVTLQASRPSALRTPTCDDYISCNRFDGRRGRAVEAGEGGAKDSIFQKPRGVREEVGRGRGRFSARC